MTDTPKPSQEAASQPEPKKPEVKRVPVYQQAQVRAENLERIAAQNLQKEIEDAKDKGVEFAVSDDELVAATDGAPINKEASPPAAPAATAPAADEPAAPRYKIKVHGKEMDLSIDELLARAQKVEAADQYLDEARQAWRATTQSAKAEPQPAAPAAPKLDDDRALARAIQMGTEEEAVAALQKLRAKDPASDEQALLAKLDDRLALHEAYARFKQDYPEIHSDEMLLNLAALKNQQLVAAGDRRPYAERFSDIGTQLREWLSKHSTDTTQQAKLQRKATVTALPTASGRAVSAPEPTEDDPDEIRAEMRAARMGRRLA